MKAALLHGPGDLRIEEVPRPAPAAGEVLLEVTGVGVCGSDASLYTKGIEGLPAKERGASPLVPGHEFAGRVVERGVGVTLAEGELVACGAGISCGRCQPCLAGRTNLCRNYRTLGVYRHGGLAEYVAAPAEICVPVGPHGVSGDDAALAQPMSIACHALARGRVEAGDRILILGVGGIGAFATWAASRIGAEVTVVDVDERRLALARTLGATTAITAARDRPMTELLASRGPWDVALETTGHDGPLQAALASQQRGGRVVLLGMHHQPRAVDFSWVTYGELDVLGTQAHVCAVDLPAALDLLGQRAEGWADVAPVALPLEQLVEEALKPLAEGRSAQIKSVIDPHLAEPRPYQR
ncbi:zinc-binding dehydrogenase [Conexibacter sp. CPCC 206217]|uniref:zinc-dependent alcohol dehydrogenase n=1 Tax=Conexibacter sp. CPCC 206217 TaxID=3064574 RepID=UPI00271DA1E0|nr:alcohol dehydrogenase catalytic domain-containing protein [Conexibacter sp. CPCC 206217]MDO8210133.1 alcohol dehydrogenase catalytic domain-containing protein [Conexibacter sp. CPCC 206217]